jgi:hypothetical protein
MIDEKLSYRGRCLRTRTGALLFGSSGDRLFVDYLVKSPGFVGRIDFIHKINLPCLFEVCSETDFTTARTVWYPSHFTMTLETDGVSFDETKYITEDDVAVSIQRWRNKSAKPLPLTLHAPYTRTQETIHGFSIGVAVRCGGGLPQVVPPGGEVSFSIVAAVGNLATEDYEEIVARAESHAVSFEGHKERYNRFFDDAPTFECSDKVLEAAWNYRWFILRHNRFRPNYGRLGGGAVMYEGRSHKKSKTPFAQPGWEFSKLINLSTPHHLTDYRWHSDKRSGREMIINFINNKDENGLFCAATVGRSHTAYANFVGVWAIYKFFLTDGDKSFVSEILGELKSYVEAERRVFGNEVDYLQAEIFKHTRTGKEYQPSYWYFHGFPQDHKNKETYTPVKRVDRSIYHYLNTLGLARLCGAVGDADADGYFEAAGRIKADVLDKMWDAETGFFYDLHWQTDEKAFVKNIVGVYPYWAEIAEPRHLPGLEKLFDADYFDTRSPFPTVARDCPAYRPGGGWMDVYVKGKNGCVWCGPSWPYTTGIAIDAIGSQSKLNGHKYDKQFGKYLRKYALQHFRDEDITRPYLVEHYDAETGEPISDEPDYNHSYFIDLIVSHVCGVGVNEDGVVFDPVDVGLEWWRLGNLRVKGKVYNIEYDGELKIK